MPTCYAGPIRRGTIHLFQALGAALLAIGLAASPARAQAPIPFTITKDFGSDPQPTSSLNTLYYQSFLTTRVIGSLAYFTATTPDAGTELWRSDGTEAGTFMLKDICPGSAGSFSSTPEFVNIGSVAYFAADDCATSIELWRSDGTRAGTQRVKDIIPGANGSSPRGLVVVGSALFFSTYTESGEQRIWRSDGTAAGTVTTNLNGIPLFGLSSGLVFAMYNSNHICTLQHLDIASNAVAQIAPFCPDGSASSGTLVAGTQLAYFSASDSSNGTELWRSDGTAAGTFLLKDIAPGQASSNLDSFAVNSQDRLFFGANDGTHGFELWTSDGSSAGTSMVKDINPGAGNSGVDSITIWHNRAYFSASDSSSKSEFWTSNGTDQGTTMVKDITAPVGAAPLRYLSAGSSALFFLALTGANTYSLYISDGTDLGTSILKDLNTSEASFTHAFGQGVIFSATDSTHGDEPWISDGTEAGTHLLKNIASDDTASSQPFFLSSLNNQLLYFGANTANPSNYAYSALYRSDGSAAGTQALKTFTTVLAPSREGSTAYQPAIYNGAIYFPAQSDATTGQELWRSDGTADGTALLDDIYPGANSSLPSYLTPSGSTLYFTARTSDSGAELWKTQGTPASTTMVKDINPGKPDADPSYLTPDGAGGVYFTATTYTNGAELWHSDGTEAGTNMIRDINPGGSSSSPYNLNLVGKTLYFVATDTTNNSLWATDGTSQGTWRISNTIPEGPIVANGARLFFTAWSADAGDELWSSDGSSNSPQLVKDIYPGINSSYPLLLTLMNGALYFPTTGSDGVRTLWKSDGSAAGTTRVVSGSGAPINPESLRVIDGRLYFSAADASGSAGRELWVSDGSAAGTHLFQDINPGASSSNPYDMIKAGQRFYLSAYASGAGIELWSATPQHEVYLPLARR